MQTNTLASAKILTTKLGLYRLIAGFSYTTLTQRNASFVSSDYKTIEEVQRAFIQAAEHLRTNNFKLAE
jgi:hypothetical protein